MAEQDEWRPIEAQPKRPLPIPPGMGIYHRGLPNIVEPFRVTSHGGEVATTSILTRQTRGPVKDRGPGECSSKAPVRYDQCHFYCTWEN